MGTRDSYTHGTFSWVENSTTDQDGAKRFYTSVFGWDYDDRPVTDEVVYTMALVDGRTVGAISPQMQNERDMGVPPHWNNYVTVDEVDAAAARVKELGGTLHVEPFDVMEAGRMAPVSDPTGAVFYLWQAKETTGAGLVNAPSAFCWNELATTDTEAAKSFYSELLGWSFESAGDEGPEYWMISNSGNLNGGIRELGDEVPPGTPSHWLPYFAVTDIDATAAKAGDGGGQVLMPKTSLGERGSFGVLADHVGSVFAIYEGQLED